MRENGLDAEPVVLDLASDAQCGPLPARVRRRRDIYRHRSRRRAGCPDDREGADHPGRARGRGPERDGVRSREALCRSTRRRARRSRNDARRERHHRAARRPHRAAHNPRVRGRDRDRASASATTCTTSSYPFRLRSSSAASGLAFPAGSDSTGPSSCLSTRPQYSTALTISMPRASRRWRSASSMLTQMPLTSNGPPSSRESDTRTSPFRSRREIAGQLGEYERFSTTIANAFVQPLFGPIPRRTRRLADARPASL